MSDIRKRTGARGTTYQVRYPNKSSNSGYAYATFNTRKEAIEFRDGSRAFQNSSCRCDIVSVEDGVQKWLDICEKEGRNGREPVTRYTLDNYEYRAGIIKKYTWEKDLSGLSKADIIEFRSWLLSNYSRDVAHKVLTSFHSMVLELVSRAVMTHDVAAGVTVSAASRYDEPVSIPTEREIASLLSAADRLANSKNAVLAKTWLRYRPMLYLAIDSGMRPQEYLVAAKGCLRPTGIEVARALEGGGTRITVTKTRAGRRLIDLTSETLQMVRHYADKHAVANGYDLIFPCNNGEWQSIRNWRRRGFGRACEEAGLMEMIEEDGKRFERPKYKPYDLRHFYASMLIDQRVNLKRIQTLMGHRNIQTTLNVYGHLIERAEAVSQERTSVLMSLSRDSCGKSVAEQS
ncbi:MAG: tyrosine-type recombinase/integrase [Nitrobacter sp.]|nr:tyrosine-type recombinase/integrase [Nitrobacter sp.]